MAMALNGHDKHHQTQSQTAKQAAKSSYKTGCHWRLARQCDQHTNDEHQSKIQHTISKQTTAP